MTRFVLSLAAYLDCVHTLLCVSLSLSLLLLHHLLVPLKGALGL